MTINYTSLLALAQPVSGTESGTWGDDVNNGITSYLDAAVAGTQTLSTDADVTLTLSQGTSTATNLSSTSAQYLILNCTGARTAARTITVPASSRHYIVLNATTGGYAVNIVGAGPTTGVSVAAGEECVVAWNGSDYIKVASSLLTALTGTLGTANGGTGLTTFTAANNALYSTSSSVLTAGTLPVAAGGTGAATLTGYVKGSGTSAFTASATVPVGDLSGTLSVGNGGTGATTLTLNNVILGNGTSAVQFVAPGANGNILTSNGTTWTSASSSSFVTLTGTQTLTNKTLTAPIISTISNTGTLTLPTSTDTLVGRATTDTLTNKTLTSPTLTSPTINDGYTEEVYAIPSSTTPALSPTNGSIQTWTLTGNSTPSAGTWAAGQSLTLMIDDGTAYTISWTFVGVTWKTNGGSAPTLNTSGFTAIQLWKVGSTIYGARVGDA